MAYAPHNTGIGICAEYESAADRQHRPRHPLRSFVSASLPQPSQLQPIPFQIGCARWTEDGPCVWPARPKCDNERLLVPAAGRDPYQHLQLSLTGRPPSSITSMLKVTKLHPRRRQAMGAANLTCLCMPTSPRSRGRRGLTLTGHAHTSTTP